MKYFNETYPDVSNKLKRALFIMHSICDGSVFYPNNWKEDQRLANQFMRVKGYNHSKMYSDKNLMLQYAKELYENVVNEFVTTSGNTVSLNNCVTGGNPGATSTTRAQVIENYLTKTYAADDPHGVPAFILASLEYETLFPTRTSKLSTVAFTGSYNDLTNKPSVPTVIFRQW
jgi:hypothetical protein